jgi:pyridoxine/pyridoxamine 5'-phosphate oxidase
MNLEEMRRNYAQRSLDVGELNSDPFAQFDQWMGEAVETQLLEPNAMALATVGADGQPLVRTVLLKGFDRRGLVFYTNYASTKARQIAGNPRVALLFNWPARQSDRRLGVATKRSHRLPGAVGGPVRGSPGALCARRDSFAGFMGRLPGDSAEL